MQSRVSSLAASLSLAPELVASRRQLEALLIALAGGQKQPLDALFRARWRRELLRATLADLLEDAAAGYPPPE